MKRFLLVLLLALSLNARAAFTEFYVQTTGNNLNAGSTTADSAVYTGVGDSDGTSIFTPSDGSTPASTVSVGDWASVYVTSGATVATFIGRVTAVGAGVNGTITVSTVAKAGTFPSASAGAHTITCKTGGAWKGPNGSSAFPISFVSGAMTNSSGDSSRFNFKGGTTYSITAGCTYSAADNVTVTIFQGYTNSPGDFGRAVIDGGTTGTSYNLLNVSGKNTTFADFTFQNNGATGSADGVTTAGGENLFLRCIAHDVRGNGFILTGGPATCNQCEAYNCNQNNTTADGGFSFQASGVDGILCFSHHNQTSSGRGVGFELDGGIHLIYCIGASNNFGVRSSADVLQCIAGCDFYNNSSHGVFFQAGGNDPLSVTVINCNFLKNGGWGINMGGTYNNGVIANCGFGSGTFANTSGTITGGKGILVYGTVTYASGVSPWANPDNGDFRINLSTAKNAGIGNFVETGNSQSGTIGYPDIGAAQHLDAGGGSTQFIVIRK